MLNELTPRASALRVAVSALLYQDIVCLRSENPGAKWVIKPWAPLVDPASIGRVSFQSERSGKRKSNCYATNNISLKIS